MAVIPRYELPEMARIFREESQVARWVQVEMAALEALARHGVIPAEVPARVRATLPEVDEDLIRRIKEREDKTRHDVAAFVDVLQESCGSEEARFIHFGLTSADVVDTALALALREALEVLTGRATELASELLAQAHRYRDALMIGRTHGVHAEPTTFGRKLWLFADQISRDLVRLQRAKEVISVGKLSGPVGTHSSFPPEAERDALALLGLSPAPATQVLARDRHAEVLYALASLGATLEAFALQVRLLAQTEVSEVLEPFGEGQKGSSAMPHKRNPVNAERLTGLARLLRGYLVAGLENVALWHERDISHSSVERVAFPDAFAIAYFMVVEAQRLVRGWEVRTDRMRQRVASSPAPFTQSLLLALVRKGMARDEAYRKVQSLSLKCVEEGGSFREMVEADPSVRSLLSAGELEEVFDLGRMASRAAPGTPSEDTIV
jgi:adenylosuccinate lyase